MFSRFGFSIDPNDQRYVFEATFDTAKKGAVLLHDFHKLLMSPKQLPPRERFIKILKPGAPAARIPETFTFPGKKRVHLPRTMDEMLTDPKKADIKSGPPRSSVGTGLDSPEAPESSQPPSIAKKGELVPSPPQGSKVYRSTYDRAHEMQRDATEKRNKERNAAIPGVRQEPQQFTPSRLKKTSNSRASPRSPRSPRKVPDQLYRSPVAKARLERHIRAASMSPR